MSILSAPVASVNPNAALVALEQFMLELDYTGRCRCDAKTIVRQTGDVSACVPSCLDREHLADAEAVYVAALPAVDFNDGDWGDPGCWLTLEDIQAAARRVPRSAAIFPPALTDAELAAYWPGGDS